MQPCRAVVGKIEFHSGLRKAHFGYKNKAHDWEDPPWEWLVKRLPTEQTEDRHLSPAVLCDIRTVAWDDLRNPINPALTQYFSPDKTGEKGARLYAKALIEEGHAVAAEVIWSVRFTHNGEEKHVQVQTYERPDL